MWQCFYEPERIRRWLCGCVLVEKDQSGQRGTRMHSVLSPFMFHTESNTQSWCCWCVPKMRTALHTNVIKMKIIFFAQKANCRRSLVQPVKQLRFHWCSWSHCDLGCKPHLSPATTAIGHTCLISINMSTFSFVCLSQIIFYWMHK